LGDLINHGSQNVFWVLTWVKTQNTFWLPWIISDMSKSTNTVVYTLIGRQQFIFTFADNVAHNLCCKFKQTIIHQHVHLRRKSQSHIHLRQESQSYWCSICNNNIVFACFNCTSHIINFGYVDYFQLI
jgi:hypothetical protein